LKNQQHKNLLLEKSKSVTSFDIAKDVIKQFNPSKFFSNNDNYPKIILPSDAKIYSYKDNIP
jgi:hypothetical protein